MHCTYLPDSRSGSPGADQYKVKGNVHWVAVQDAVSVEVRLYDRLFRVPNPGAGDSDFLQDLNPDSKRVIQAQLEPSLRQAAPGETVQFERHGYFVADRVDTQTGAPVFNRTVTLRDSWAKATPDAEARRGSGSLEALRHQIDLARFLARRCGLANEPPSRSARAAASRTGPIRRPWKHLGHERGRRA